jgi:tetratricopeptide (TPR) repeat protein
LRDPSAGKDFTNAIVLATNAGVNSTVVADLIQLGRLLHDAKDHGASERYYQAVIDLTQGRPEFAAQRALAYRLRAEPLLQLKRYPEAEEALTKYIETAPLGVQLPPELAGDVGRAYKARGVISVERKDFRAAVDSYTVALAVRRDADTLALRGWAYLMWEAPPLADADFQESLALKATGDAHLGRAAALVKMGRRDDAVAAAERGVEADVKGGRANERTYYHAARVFAQAAGADGGDRRHGARAVELLCRAVSLVPEDRREAFWQGNVEGDAAFEGLRRGGLLDGLRPRP